MRGFYLVLLFILIIAPNNAFARTCVSAGSMEMRLHGNPLVIIGEVIKSKKNYFIYFLDGYGKEKEQELTFKVDEVLHGEYDKTEIKIIEHYVEKDRDNGDVGFGFEIGKKYLVFVKKNTHGVYRSSANGFCRSAWLLESEMAKRDIKRLEKYNNTKE